MVEDRSLASAAELLTAHGRRHDAILLVAIALRERRDADTALLLVLLLHSSGTARDRAAARHYLRRVQWQSFAPITERP
jgi:hypothetical protein